MAKQFSKKEEGAYIAGVVKSKTDPVVISNPTDEWNKFLGQRNRHRDILCNFAIDLTVASFLFLVVLVLGQAIIRATINPTYQAISDTALDIIAVSVFGEAIGVVAIIANQIWDGNEFGSSRRLKKK